MKKKIFFLLLCFVIIKKSQAQIQLSQYSEISIVTAGPGDALYEKFGHAAIRIKDPLLQIDLIYNYGIFDFNTPNFYTNFAQGKMYYLLAKYDFKYFLESYKKDKRWLNQQILNLNQTEKQEFFKYLEKNVLEENATYLYDPFFDNCATKLRDISQIILKNKIVLESTKIADNISLRTLMNQEIHWNTWGNFGINLIAGTILDKERNQLAYTYLPDYLYNTFKYGTIERNGSITNLIKREDSLLNFEEIRSSFMLFNPLQVFIALLIAVLYSTYREMKRQSRKPYIDFIIFLSTGIIGLILSYLWAFSSHKTAPNNFNLLWAFMPNIYVAFIFGQSQISLFSKSIKIYILALLACLLAIVALWILGIQIFPVTVIPLLILLFVRYIFLYRFLLTFKK
jgi:hypothetical protein